MLKNRDIYEDVIREVNGGVMPVKMLSMVFGDQEPTLLDEYQSKIDELKRSLKEANSKLFKEQNERLKLVRADETSLVARSELQIIEEENPENDNDANKMPPKSNLVGQVPWKNDEERRYGQIRTPSNSSH